MLRTVTFSDPKVAELANANFVCAWFNRSAGFCNTDNEAEKSIFTSASEAFLTKNICTFVLTPEGCVFHYIAGYVAPEIFLGFLDDSLVLRRAGFDGKMGLKPDGLQSMRSHHADRAARFEKEAAATPAQSRFTPREYRGMTHSHGPNCDWGMRSASTYLARVHRAWEKAATLPTLDEVRFKYLYGNAFTEEGKGATPIANDLAVRQDK